MFWVARLLQLVGIMEVTYALLVAFTGGSMSRELTFLGIGAGLFWMGRLLERKT